MDVIPTKVKKEGYTGVSLHHMLREDAPSWLALKESWEGH